MPTYDYKCLDCENVFEHFQSIKDEPLAECLCEKKGKVSRMISNGGGIIFKGSGFYVNDYKKTSGSTESNSSAPASSPAPAPTPTPSNQGSSS